MQNNVQKMFLVLQIMAFECGAVTYLSLLGGEFMQSAVNVLRNILKISDMIKTDVL